ncbi:hypothetical protein JHK85_025814 [Glycine max]|nr:hypothetical protein JHK85_025814 [Glycine max]
MESNQTNPEQLSKHKIQNCEEWDDGGSSFSASFMSKSQDISFGAGSPTSNMADVNAIAGETNLGRLLLLQDSPLWIGRDVKEMDHKQEKQNN